MTQAIVALCRALAAVLDAHYWDHDRETSALMTARKNQRGD